MLGKLYENLRRQYLFWVCRVFPKEYMLKNVLQEFIIDHHIICVPIIQVIISLSRLLYMLKKLADTIYQFGARKISVVVILLNYNKIQLSITTYIRVYKHFVKINGLRAILI
jgi:hypothetical protein